MPASGKKYQIVENSGMQAGTSEIKRPQRELEK
jgi:hypothetical protein